MNDLRSLQMVCLDILKEIDRICKKHNILYWMEGGSMLGAVRHHGFIPWDDDLDIAMFRNDYNRFLEIAPKELNENYFLQTHQTDPEYPLFFAKVRKNNTFIDERSYEELNIHKGIFVDIFPVDKMPLQMPKIKRFCFSLRTLYLFYITLERRVNTKTTDRFFILFKMIRFFLFPVSLCKEYFRRKFEKKLQKYNKMKNEIYVGSLTVVQFMKWVYKKEWFKNFKSFRFEDMDVLIPSGYHELLTNVYGDYMTPPPKEKQILGHGLSFSTDIRRDRNEQ